MTSGTFNSISTTVIRVAAAQVNTTVGDIDGNSQLIEKWIKIAQLQQAELIAFPELTITGYPPEDLVLYGFLGVFIIFVLDSFNKSAKYKR